MRGSCFRWREYCAKWRGIQGYLDRPAAECCTVVGKGELVNSKASSLAAGMAPTTHQVARTDIVQIGHLGNQVGLVLRAKRPLTCSKSTLRATPALALDSTFCRPDGALLGFHEPAQPAR